MSLDFGLVIWLASGMLVDVTQPGAYRVQIVLFVHCHLCSLEEPPC